MAVKKRKKKVKSTSEPVNWTKLYLAFSVLLGVILFAENLNSYFLSDDFLNITVGPVSILSIPAGLFPRGDMFVRPVAVWMYSLVSGIDSGSPLLFHTVSLILHLGCVVLVYRLVRVLFESIRTAQLTAAIFMLSSIHAETVAWISCWFDLTATILLLGGLNAWISWRLNGRRFHLVISYILFVLAILSKEAVYVFPFLLALCEWRIRSGKMKIETGIPNKKGLSSIYIALGFCIVLLILRWVGMGGLGGYVSADSGSLDILNWLRNVFLMPLVHLFFPTNLRILSQLPVYIQFVWGAVILLIPILSLVFSGRRSLTTILWSWLWITICMLPVYSIGEVLPDLQSSRFLYLPSVGSSILLGYSLDSLLKWFHRGEKKGVRTRTAELLIALFLVANAYMLRENLYPWIDAGNQSRLMRAQFVEMSADIPEGTTIGVINLPETVLGAYISRNGFPEAVSMWTLEKGFFVQVSLDEIYQSYLSHQSGELGMLWLIYWDLEEERFERLPDLPPEFFEYHLEMQGNK